MPRVTTTHHEVAKAREAGILPEVYVVACGKSKRSEATRAADLYTGDLTAKQIAWVSTRRGPFGTQAPALIASALHGLVDFDTELEPYDVTLNDFTPAQLEAWSNLVAAQAVERGIEDARVTVHGGARYTKALRKAFTRVHNPDTTEGTFRSKSLELGERKAALKSLLDWNASYVAP